MTCDRLKFERVDFENAEKAIEIQREIFPEDGLLDILASLDKDIFVRETGINYFDDNAKYFLAKNERGIVGILGLYLELEMVGKEKEVWLAWFGVLPKWRKRGYATGMLEWIVNRSLEEGYGVMRLYTDIDENADAVKLYKKMGFVGEEYTAEELDWRCVVYSRNLRGGEVNLWKNRFLDLASQEELERLDLRKKERILQVYKEKYFV